MEIESDKTVLGKYDSSEDTKQHIHRVKNLLYDVIDNLLKRAKMHDLSKLESPEKEIFDEYTPKLKNCTYGSEEYKDFLKGLKVALDHHYSVYDHHPEHTDNGIDGMSLLSLIEMFADWKAATERHADGSLSKSIEINKKRFKISDQLEQVFKNTQKELGW
jgi:hypothetical protein